MLGKCKKQFTKELPMENIHWEKVWKIPHQNVCGGCPGSWIYKWSSLLSLQEYVFSGYLYKENIFFYYWIWFYVILLFHCHIYAFHMKLICTILCWTLTHPKQLSHTIWYQKNDTSSVKHIFWKPTGIQELCFKAHGLSEQQYWYNNFICILSVTL